MKKEKVILIGASGSGKDYFRKKIVDNFNIKYYPKFTTRPIRTGEKNYIDYNYITETKFDELYTNNQILVYQKFKINNDIWIYGYTKSDYNDTDILILTPSELSALHSINNGIFLENTCVIYLNIDEDIRRSRLLKRNDINDSIDRRIDSDNYDFSLLNKDLVDVIIYNEFENPIEIYDKFVMSYE